MAQEIEGVSVIDQQADLRTPPDVDQHRFGAWVGSAGDGVVWLALSGDIDLAVRDQLRDIVQTRLAGEGVRALLIDLAAVTFLDCGAIGVLVGGCRRAADVGCGYGVVKAVGIAARLFDLTGVRPLLEFPVAGAGDGDAGRLAAPASGRSRLDG